MSEHYMMSCLWMCFILFIEFSYEQVLNNFHKVEEMERVMSSQNMKFNKSQYEKKEKNVFLTFFTSSATAIGNKRKKHDFVSSI